LSKYLTVSRDWATTLRMRAIRYVLRPLGLKNLRNFLRRRQRPDDFHFSFMSYCCCYCVRVFVCVCVTSSLPVRGPVADFWTLLAGKSSVRKSENCVCLLCLPSSFLLQLLFIFLFWRSNFKWPAMFIYYCGSTRRCNCSCWHNKKPNQLLTTGRVSSRNINTATAAATATATES